jgi:hypothetical protein
VIVFDCYRTHSLHYTRTAFFPTVVSLPVLGSFDEFITSPFSLFIFSFLFLLVSFRTQSTPAHKPRKISGDSDEPPGKKGKKKIQSEEETQKSKIRKREQGNSIRQEHS